MAHRPASWIARVVTPLVALGALFATLELGLRLAGYDPLGRARAAEPEEARGLFLRPSSVAGLDYELEPGFVGEVWGSAVRINAHGLRDRETSLDKPPGTYRILAVGDSITFGNRIAVEQTFAERLEQRFGDRPVEVLNLGVGGYDTLQEVVRLEHVGLPFEPDRVVLAYCINDAGVASVNRKYVERLGAYDSPLYRSRVVQLLALNRDRLAAAEHAVEALDDERFATDNREWIADVTADAAVLERIERLRREIAGPVDPREHRFLPWYASTARIGKLRFAFERLAALARERGFGVSLAIVPHLNEGDRARAYGIVYETVAHEAARVGFDVVDLYRPLAAAGFETVRVNRIHPNERGHAIIAEALYEHLTRVEPRLAATETTR